MEITEEIIKKYMEFAEELVAPLSPDEETKVGAVFLNQITGKVTSWGCNKFVENAPLNLPTTRPDKYQYILHAEKKAINMCAKYGYSVFGNILICTMSPCPDCLRTIYDSGVREVFYKDVHWSFKSDLLDILIKIDQKFGYNHMILLEHVL